jgi:Cdc6-like AAA superfamily ATPase
VEAIFDGYNSTFLAYGQTGTGKTHTVFGSDGFNI